MTSVLTRPTRTATTAPERAVAPAAPAAPVADAAVVVPAVTLDRLAPGSRARVLAVTSGPARRLAELGVRRGTEVRVVTRSAGGGVTLAVGTSRLALDRAVLRGIEVAAA